MSSEMALVAHGLGEHSNAACSFPLHASAHDAHTFEGTTLGENVWVSALELLRSDGPINIAEVWYGNAPVPHNHNTMTRGERVLLPVRVRVVANKVLSVRVAALTTKSALSRVLLENDDERTLYTAIYTATFSRVLRDSDSDGNSLGDGTWRDPMVYARDVARLAVLDMRALAGDACECSSKSAAGVTCARGAFHTGMHTVRPGPYAKQSAFGRADGVVDDWSDGGAS